MNLWINDLNKIHNYQNLNLGGKKMSGEAIININSITLEDCMDLYDKKGISIIVNDGKIKDFLKEKYR